MACGCKNKKKAEDEAVKVENAASVEEVKTEEVKGEDKKEME